MRTLLMILTFALTAGFASAQAKTCSKAEKAACAKTCTAAQKAACAKTAAAAVNVSDTQVLSASAAADLAAENDASIERKECATSGKVSYIKNYTCSASGKDMTKEVTYCSKSGAFLDAKGQTCSKSAAKTCTKGAAKTCSKGASKATTSVNVDKTQVLSAIAAADLAAENDENIERRECSMSGKVSYFHKSTCAKSGKVSMNEVKYCSDSQAFVNASPSEVMSDKAAKVIKTADTVDGKVQKTSATKKKACCKGKKACSKTKTGA